MARPVKDGLDYFPKDTGFYHDPKIRALIGRFGSDGAVLYDYLLCETYGRNGYYMEMDDLFVDIIAADLGVSPEKIGLILDYLLNKSMLLDGTLFKAVKVLTSHGIQTRYQEAVRGRAKNRGISVNGELWLLNKAETESFVEVRLNDDKSRINIDKSKINHDKSGINSAKEIKENKIKGKERKGVGVRSAHFAPPTLEEVTAYVKERGSRVDPQGFIDFYASKGWMVGKTPMKDWKAACRNAEHWDRWDKVGRCEKKDFQPDAERIRRNNEWMDRFLAQQEQVKKRNEEKLEKFFDGYKEEGGGQT